MKSTKKKLLFVYPKSFSITIASSKYAKYFTDKSGGLMNAALATIAALTPAEFEIKIIDENIEDINFDEHYDIVGFTGFPTQIKRARQLAEEFSKRGVLVVCGGASVSLSPERWRSFADVLIIGEAERIWPEFIKDYIKGCHKSEYHETERFDLDISPVPDYSGLSEVNRNKFMGGIVQTSRGCPFQCEFCDVIIYVGRKMRYKPIDKVVKEVEQLYNLGIRIVFLADDNFSAGRKNAKKILRALRDWSKKKKNPVTFATQLSIDIAKDEEFLELATEAGLSRVFVGIETPNVDSLKEAHKLQNTRSNLIEDVKIFHQHGIMVISGCVVGFDNDDLSIFQQQFDFFMKAGIPNVNVYPLQAPDGTPLKERMIKEGRYIDEYTPPTVDEKYANLLNTFTIIPKQMTIDQLHQGTEWLHWNLNDPENVIKRLEIFFKDFDNSPKKDKLVFPKTNLPRKGLPFIWKFAKYYLTKATPLEKKHIRKLLSIARRSSHPRSLGFAMANFIQAKNARDLIQMQNPEVTHISYPKSISKALTV